MKTKNGQIAPLKDRHTALQLAKRQERRKARTTLAAQLTGQMNLMRAQMRAFVSMGMIERWKLRRQMRKAGA